MSNETDLDWLARNVHVWPAGDHQPWCYVYWKWGYRAVSGNCITVIQPCVRVEMSQWLTRRAVLQNKPSWETHEYKVIAQGRNGSWYGSNYSEEKFGHENSFCITGTGWNFICRGVDLGDWRDTLENRPEEFKPSIEDANRLAQEFKPFISIEDNQEQEMKQDNGWFERGELPPVGFECEMKRIDGRWCKAVTVGKDSGGRMVCELNDNGVFYASTSSEASFRPIRTERDELIEIISSSLLVTNGQVADAIIAAGFKLEAK